MNQQVQLAAFRVGAEEYVVDIRRIQEIIRPIPITPVRKGPKFVEGVINLRGSVIPIVDMRRRFDLPVESQPTERIMIMVIEGRTVGLVVDAVSEVLRIERSAIRSAEGLLDREQAPFFLGVCYAHGRTFILLDVKNVVNSSEDIDLTTAQALAQPEVVES